MKRIIKLGMKYIYKYIYIIKMSMKNKNILESSMYNKGIEKRRLSNYDENC